MYTGRNNEQQVPTRGCKIMRNLGIWCDLCNEWVDDFIPDGTEILCAYCHNALLQDQPIKKQKSIRIDLAKAMWNLR